MGIKLDNRVAVVTGGASGIGRGTVLAFAGAGAAVAVWDLAEEAGQALVSEIRDNDGKAAFFKVNVAVQADVEAATAATIERFGKIDILVNNAGITRDGLFVRVKEGQLAGKMSESDFDAVIGVNLKGVFNCTQAIVPGMIMQGYGRIINASSIVGQYGNFGQTNYVAAKAGVVGLTKVWARELGKRGITANAIRAGVTDTPALRKIPGSDVLLDGARARNPAGRLTTPEDVARALIALASPDTYWLTGNVLNVDGGEEITAG